MVRVVLCACCVCSTYTPPRSRESVPRKQKKKALLFFFCALSNAALSYLRQASARTEKKHSSHKPLSTLAHTGWLEAPATGSFEFGMDCDDSCDFATSFNGASWDNVANWCVGCCCVVVCERCALRWLRAASLTSTLSLSLSHKKTRTGTDCTPPTTPPPASLARAASSPGPSTRSASG